MAVTEEQLSVVDYGVLASLYEMRSYATVLAFGAKNEHLFEVIHKFDDIRIPDAIKAIIENTKTKIAQLEKDSETAVGKTAVTDVMLELTTWYLRLQGMEYALEEAEEILDLIEARGLGETLKAVPTPMLMRAIKEKEITKERLSTENDPQGGSSGG